MAVRRSFLVALSLLLGTVSATAPASARPTHLPPVALFGSTPTTGYPISVVTPDGTAVVGRETPGGEGRLQVQVRRPGGRWGATTTLATGAAGAQAFGLALLAGPRGDVAATWYSQSVNATLVSFLARGSRVWSSPRSVGLSGFASAVDVGGRLWAVGPDATSTVVRIVARAGPPRSIRLPAAASGFSDTVTGLVLAADGSGRLALVRRSYLQSGGDFFVQCSESTELWTAEVKVGSGASMSRLEQHHASGSGTPGFCPLLSGSQVASAQLVTDAGGVGTLVSQRTDLDRSRTTIVARRSAAGRPWPLTASAVLPPGAVSLAATAVVGSRVTVLAYDLGSTPGLLLTGREGSGRWSASRRLAHGNPTFVSLAGSPAGGLIAYRTYESPYRVLVRAVSRGGALGTSRVVTASATDALGAVGVDARGDGGVVRLPSDGAKASFLAYDAAGPRLTAVSVPIRIRAGARAALAARATDTWSGVHRYTWTVDGHRHDGRTIRVRLTRPGRYRVVLTVADARGNATVVRRSVLVSSA